MTCLPSLIRPVPVPREQVEFPATNGEEQTAKCKTEDVQSAVRRTQYAVSAQVEHRRPGPGLGIQTVCFPPCP